MESDLIESISKISEFIATHLGRAAVELQVFKVARNLNGFVEDQYHVKVRFIIEIGAAKFTKPEDRKGQIVDGCVDAFRQLIACNFVGRPYRSFGEIDIKYGSGGMLDIYFAIRYLQLRDGIADVEGKRSSAATLDVLRERGSLTPGDHTNLIEGYKFLSTFDHYLRLIVGRSTKVPVANTAALQAVADRMNAPSVDDLLGQLNGHRLNIRASYDHILNQTQL